MASEILLVVDGVELPVLVDSSAGTYLREQEIQNTTTCTLFRTLVQAAFQEKKTYTRCGRCNMDINIRLSSPKISIAGACGPRNR